MKMQATSVVLALLLIAGERPRKVLLVACNCLPESPYLSSAPCATSLPVLDADGVARRVRQRPGANTKLQHPQQSQHLR